MYYNSADLYYTHPLAGITPMRSVRFGQQLERDLTKASEVTGQSASEIIRSATQERCNRLLGRSAHEMLKPFIGRFASTSAARRRTPLDDNRAVGKLMTKDLNRQPRRRRR